MRRTISSYQNVLRNFVFQEPTSRAEMLAQERFHKKLEVPERTNTRRMIKHAEQRWLIGDLRLTKVAESLVWSDTIVYRLRCFMHQFFEGFNIKDLQQSDIRFPKGAEYDKAFKGISLEARLSRKQPLHCTKDNFGAAFELIKHHHGLKTAVRKRFNRNFRTQNERRDANQAIYYKALNIATQYRSSNKMFSFCGYNKTFSTRERIFKHQVAELSLLLKFAEITNVTEGSRLGSVPKNNKERRPINIEPFWNLLTQSQVGMFIRTILKENYGIDLETLAATHRVRISDTTVATIDLSKASDRILLKLCDLIMPAWVCRELKNRRSPKVLTRFGWYEPAKLSSMGNGFTFEVLSLLCLALTRIFDDTATSFGDDIICKNKYADSVIEALVAVGLEVNIDKSFVYSDFRESCGAFYIDGHGYVEGYDFRWPNNIGDCVKLCAKAARLAQIYPSFKPLYHSFVRATTPALRGFEDKTFLNKEYLHLYHHQWEPDLEVLDLPDYFITPRNKVSISLQSRARAVIDQMIADYQWESFDLIPVFRFKTELRSQTLATLKTRLHWAKYLMYLSAGRRSDDPHRKGQWASTYVGLINNAWTIPDVPIKVPSVLKDKH